MPQSLYMEDCEGTTVKVARKVAAITVTKCTNVRLDFTGSIGTVEFINCTNCRVTCTQSCSLYTLDSCADIRIMFPGTQDTVKVVTSNSQRIDLTAVQTDGHDVTRTVSSLPHMEYSGADLAAQDSLHWSSATASFTEQTPLQREGIGYITNL